MKWLLRGPGATRLLSAMGIEPRRYWLLTDLFGELAERREVMNQLGRDGFTLKVASWLYGFIGAVCCIGFLTHAPTAAKYLLTFVLVTSLMLFFILVSEAGNSLVNPVEGVVLAHQPIDGATYTAAKLTHLLRIVAFLALAMNAVPSAASLLLLKEPFWYYPLLHIAATYGAGLLVALLACALFGWLLLLVPAPRLKSVAQIVEMVPLLGLMFAGQIWPSLARKVGDWLPEGSPWRRNLGISLPVVAVVIAAMGLRALSGDYLIRVASIAHGGGGGRTKPRRSRMGDVVARLLGGPPARAGFAYTARMMRRDWAFRRQLISIIPCAISPAILLAKGVHTDPFSGQFSAVHVIPHVFGIVLFLVAVSMVYGSDHKGSWLFLLTPSGAFAGFARGVYGLLWISVIGIPHAVLLVPLAWYWGVAHALLFAVFSVSVATLYLGLVLRLIDAVPFSKQPVTSRGVYFMGIMFGGSLVISIAVGLQYLLVFRSVTVVAGVTVTLAGAAWFVTRASLDTFTTAMRYNLSIESAEVGSMFQEVDA